MTAMIQAPRILVVEDEYLLAADLVRTLASAGATVVGPVSGTDAALALIGGHAIDAALLDINLSGEAAFAVADALAARRTPFAFVTGYDRRSLPDRFAHVAFLEKPATAQAALATLGALLSAGPGG